MKCFVENFLELDIDELLAVNGGYGSSSRNGSGSGSGDGGGGSGSGSYGAVTSNSRNQTSWDVWVANKDGRNSSGEITRPHDPYRDSPRDSGNYKGTSFVPDHSLTSGGKEEESVLGAPTDSRRITGVIGEETPLQPSHTGVDIGAVEPGVKGDPIYAVEDGTIIRVGTTSNSGSSILEQDLPNTDDTAVYQHGEFIVEEGDTVERGEVIGYMSDIGTPGQVHLHFEIREDGQYAGPGGTGELVDPLDYLPSSYSSEN